MGEDIKPFRLASKKSSPQLPILNEEEIRVKFKKDIVIRCDSMSRCKVFRRFGNIENIVQLEVSM
jgi:hypothetical protein